MVAQVRTSAARRRRSERKSLRLARRGAKVLVRPARAEARKKMPKAARSLIPKIMW